MSLPKGFGNYQFVPGLGFIEPREQNDRAAQVSGQRGLRGDDSVMMISGLSDPPLNQTPAVSTTPGQGPQPQPQAQPAAGPLQSFSAMGAAMPWWAWLLVGIMIGVFIGRKQHEGKEE